MRKIMNAPKDFVDDFLDRMLKAHPRDSRSVPGFPRALTRVEPPGVDPRGGGRLKATVLGRPIALPEIVDSSCQGTALLAAVGEGTFPDCSAAVAAMVHMKCEDEPESAQAQAYADRYEEYWAIRAAWTRQQSITPISARREG
jgi:hypothetical protein